MPNSTYLYTVNKCLEGCGQRQIPDAATFNDPIKLLSRVQQQARFFVDLVNRMYLRTMCKGFVIREFQIFTSPPPAPNLYPLDASISAESLIYNSLFNITPQTTPDAPITAHPLHNWEYREFRTWFPDFSIIPTGPPQRWILLPRQANDDPSSPRQIMFYPVPDAQYTINYQGKLSAVPLVVDTDELVWPVEYEDIIWTYGAAFLERALGEGKEGDIERYAELALKEVSRWSTNPEEVRKAIRVGLFTEGISRGRRVSRYFTSSS